MRTSPVRTAPVPEVIAIAELEVLMSPADPALEELVRAAHDLAEEAVASLASSGDLCVARLGQAIRELRREDSALPGDEVQDGADAIDPVTHDPAW
ncbi:hypothetical protein EDD98_5922 [Streptomyces sp. PanSC19]|uniref:Uncharacterized protein n=1 Tax=Streptomyces litmocidini TaxID=67318 RepID=A0ABW7UBU2_9ACTN|nr:hypothetical protein [Streptomyces sp. PanSC19]ROQ26295.1 hypothetical protein EDD98_5922 [Streptomyces sp. PanSC19]